MAEPRIKARPTLYRGTLMRSRLEADFAGALDRCGLEWEYEPCCFGGPAGQWLPDFRFNDHTYVELKPARRLLADPWSSAAGVEGEMAGRVAEVNATLRRMTVAWESEPGACLVLLFWSYGLPYVMDAPLVLSRVRGSPRWHVMVASLGPGIGLKWPHGGGAEDEDGPWHD